MNSSRLNKSISPYARSTSAVCVEAESAGLLLRELFDLLEEYGPAWYTEELHERAASVLGDVPVITE